MKILAILFFTIISVSASAQNTYNNQVNNLKELNIYGGNSKISIGKILVNPTIKPKLLLSGYTQVKDTADTYKTTFIFNSVDNLPFFGVNVYLRFNESVSSVHAIFNGTAMIMSEGQSQDMKEYQFKASQINADSFSIEIVSKTKIFTTMYGVDGMAGQ